MDENVGLGVHKDYLYGVLSCDVIWVQFGAIQCTLQNFRSYNFQKATASTVFIQFQLNFMESMVIRGKYQLLLFGSQFLKKKYGSLNFC